MAKGEVISIDTNKLKTGLSRFDSAKTKFNNNVYGTYKSSYFKTSGNSQVAKLRKTSDTLYKDLKEMYNNIKTYTEDYIESIQDLENDLKNGKCSTRDQATMRAAINQLNAILDGADPDEIDINPKTGELEFGGMSKFEEWATNGHGWKGSAFSINTDKFNAANASSVISYRDENGKLVKIEGYNSNERTMIMTAAMTNNMNYYRMVMNSNNDLKEKTANIYTATYANSPAVMGFLEASNPLPVTLEKLIDVKYTKKQQNTVNASKEGLGYGAGYFGGMAFSFVTGGGLIGEKALGEGALKVIAKTGGKTLTDKKTIVFAVNRFSDVFSSAPLNISDSLKSSYDSSGKIDWKQFGKMMAINTGSDIVFGGLLDGVGIGVSKLVSKSGNIRNAFAAIGDSVKNYNFHSKAGFMRIPGLNRDSFVMPRKGMHKLQVQVVKDVENMGLLDKNVGNKIYNMFKDDNYIYGIHRTPSKKSADDIMNDGLILSGHNIHGVSSQDVDLDLNISFRENKSDFDFAMFVRDIKSASSYKTSGDLGYAMVVRLPKNYDINDLITYKNGQPVLKNDYIVGKIEVDKGNVYKSENTIFRDDIKVKSADDMDIDELLARYNELMKIKDSDEYKNYRDKVNKNYAVEVKQEFVDIAIELPKIEKRLSELASNDVKNDFVYSNNVGVKSINDVEANELLARYNELMKIKDSNEYKVYRYNELNGIPQKIRSDFNRIGVELYQLEQKLSKLANNGIKTGSSYSNNVKNTLDNIVTIIDNKNYPGYGIKVLDHYIKTGNINVITSTGNCRQIIRNLDNEYIIKYLNDNNKVVSNIKFSNIGDIKKYGKNSINDSSDLMKFINTMFNRKDGQSSYTALVRMNTKRAKLLPSYNAIKDYENFIKKYGLSYQGKKSAFVHVSKNRSNMGDVAHRLYINAEYESTYKFAKLFAEECEKQSLPFYFKTGNNLAENINMLHRDESIVIYSGDSNIVDYINISKKIIAENPDMKMYSPPGATSLVDDYIGYGMEPYLSGTSFNSVRANIFEFTSIKGMEKFIKDNNSLIINGRRLGDWYKLELANVIKTRFPAISQGSYSDIINNLSHAYKNGYTSFKAGKYPVDTDMIYDVYKNLNNSILKDNALYKEQMYNTFKDVCSWNNVDFNNFAFNMN